MPSILFKPARRRRRVDERPALPPQISKECSNILSEKLGFLGSGEVASARHLGPTLHIVPAFDPGTRREWFLFGKADNRARHLHEVIRPEIKWRSGSFVVQTKR